MNISLKCTKFVPYTVKFADGYGREGPFFILCDKLIQLK